MRRLAVIALIVALGMSALWLASRRSAEPRAVEEVALRSESADEQPEVELATPEAPEQVAHELEAQRSPVPAAPVAHTTSRRAPSAPLASAPIAGRVVRPDGTPVPNAEVELECAEPFRSKLGPLASTRTDAQGRFGLECERTGPFRVQATEYEKRRIVAQVAREDVFPSRGEVELVLQPALARGRVVDDLERPIPDFRITWTPVAPDGKAQEGGASERFRSASGEFSSTLSPGEWRASVKAHGDYVTAQVDFLVPDLAPTTIVLARQGLVRGVVVDELGQRVPRAQLSAPEGGAWNSASNGDGSFELGVKPETTFTLWAEEAHHAPSPGLNLSLAPAEKRDGVVLQLGALAHLSGEVVDPHGRPVSARRVRLYQQNASCWNPEPMSDPSTDAAGRFEVDVVPGHTLVSVALSDDEMQALGPAERPLGVRSECERSLTLAPGESAWIRLAMGGSPVHLHGRIVVDGRMPARARVIVRGSAWHADLWSREDGTYEAQLPEPGLYWFGITVGDMDVSPFVDVPSADEFRCDVSIPVGRLSGHVRDEAGHALEGVVVDAYSHGEGQLMQSSARATSDGDGAYALTVVPGTLRVDPREDFEEQRSFRETPEQIVRVEPDGELHDVDFVLQTIGALDGRVRRADGGPLLHASIAATSLRLQSECDDETDDDGLFHLPLDGGAHWINATATDGTSVFILPEPMRVELARGELRALELTLVPAVFVRVRLAAEGELAFVQLEALDERGRSFASNRADDDARELLLVPPGPYTLRARRDERLFERSLELPAGNAELALDWRLE